jgi:HTH-type transcriptional regulator / antitoxin HigA
MRAVAEIANPAEYAQLLGDALPHVIHTEGENDRCTALLEKLLRQKKRTAEEKRLAELLTLLIEQFEEREHALPVGDPVDMLRHLMDSNDLRQVDLLDVFGTASVISEVLRGKRELSKAHIAKLSERFQLSPALFFS